MKYAVLVVACLVSVGCSGPANLVEKLTKEEPQKWSMDSLPKFLGREFGKHLSENESFTKDKDGSNFYIVDVSNENVEAAAKIEVVDGVMIGVSIDYTKPTSTELIFMYQQQNGIAPSTNTDGSVGWKFKNGTITVDNNIVLMKYSQPEP